MGPVTARFLALLFAALALAPALAHLLELPNKIGLSRDEYFTVQQIYSGWALLGIVVFGALFSTLALAVQWEYSHAASAVLNLIAFIAVILSVLARDKS